MDTISSATTLLDAMHILSDTVHGTADTPAPSANTALIREPAKCACCRIMILQERQPTIKLHVDNHGLLLWRSKIDGTIQIVVSVPLRQRILTLAGSSLMAIRPGERRLYDRLQCKFFWPHIASVLYCTVDPCTSCARNQCRYRLKACFTCFLSWNHLIY